MVGDVNQRLHLGALPDGLTFTLEEVRTKLAWWQKQPHFGDLFDNQWSVGFYGPNKEYPDAKADRKGEKHWNSPREVKVGNEIGRTKFVPGNGLTASGPTGTALIRFRLQGTTKGDGKDISVNQLGYITIGTSDWKGLSRPDYSKVTYHLEGGFSMTHDLEVPVGIGGMPDDVHFVIGLDPSSNEIGIGITTSSDLISRIGNFVLEGIFKGHEKALGWAVGKLNPLSG